MVQRRASFASGGPESVKSVAGTPPRDKDENTPDLNNVFYQGEIEQPDANKSPSKPPLQRAKTTADGQDLNPFSMEPSAQKSIPTILDILSKVDFDVNFGPKT